MYFLTYVCICVLCVGDFENKGGRNGLFFFFFFSLIHMVPEEDFHRLEAELSATKSELEASKDKKANLEAQLTQLGIMTTEVEQLRARNSGLEDQNAQQAAHINKLEEKVAQLEQENAEQATHINTLENKVAQLEQDIDGLKKENAELKRDNVELNRDNVELKRDIDGLKRDNVELKKDVAIHKSAQRKTYNQFLLGGITFNLLDVAAQRVFGVKARKERKNFSTLAELDALPLTQPQRQQFDDFMAEFNEAQETCKSIDGGSDDDYNWPEIMAELASARRSNAHPTCLFEFSEECTGQATDVDEAPCPTPDELKAVVQQTYASKKSRSKRQSLGGLIDFLDRVTRAQGRPLLQ
jgi:uncharacterized coiled-coil protein SlyX